MGDAGPDAVTVAVSPVGDRPTSVVVTVVDGGPAGGGAAAASGPPTPAFWPQAADTSTAVTATRARIFPAVRIENEGSDP
jgi:hypothetical protein